MPAPDRPDHVGHVDRVVSANGRCDEIDRIERGVRGVLRERYQTLGQNDRSHLVLLLATGRSPQTRRKTPGPPQSIHCEYELEGYLGRRPILQTVMPASPQRPAR